MEGKVLFVDDDPIVIKSCKYAMEDSGLDLTGVTSPVEALKLIGENDYDVVVTDIVMPEIDGFELIRRTKAMKPDIGIVVITGYSSQQNIRDAIEMGIIDYLAKPFTPNMLTEVMAKALTLAIRRKPVIKEKPLADELEAKMKSEDFLSVINKYRDVPGSLITVLEEAQALIGYLPPSVQKLIAKGMRIPVSEVYSVVSFYPYFTMKIRGRHNVKVCIGAACHTKGAPEIISNLKEGLKIADDTDGMITKDMRFSLETVRCLGACGFAPVVEIDHDTHGGVDPAKSMDLLKDYE
ncbi:MAG: NAD(P)H-dependent oxidoreductase subunit E [Nitrospirae bacterium]|nr:NAD(P)H-dependent oxidoreductase subunit E [Nitrospirota bacterium]